MEATFVIDRAQRIAQWSPAAAALLGVTETAALGRHCYEVVQARDPFGKSFCRPDCAAFQAMQGGALTSRCSLLVQGPNNRRKLLARLLALPPATGGVLVTLGERPVASLPFGGEPGLSPSDRAPSATDLGHQLATLGALATSLSPRNLEQSIEAVLEWVRHAAEAEVAELFLVEPQGRDALLAAFQGPFRPAFLQMTRFATGVGFPGLVLSSGELVWTHELLQDSRYLRSRVKEKGFQSYVCLPLYGAQGIIGVLNVASRRPDMDIERAHRVMSWAGGPLSTTLEAATLQVRLEATSGVLGAAQKGHGDMREQMREALRFMVGVGKASGGVMMALDQEREGVLERVVEGDVDGDVHPDAQHGGFKACPALAGGHGIALSGPRGNWPPVCRQVCARGSVVHCVPLVAGQEVVGLAQLRYAHGGPSPLTSHLTTLLAIGEQVAQVLAHTRSDAQGREPALGLHDRLLLESGSPIVTAMRVQEHALPSVAHAQSEFPQPFLDVRCFGSFELHRQGRLVTPAQVPRRGALSLLKVLLLHLGRPLSRDALAELLWPEADPESASNRLYVLVHALRRVVEPSVDGRGWTFIRSEGDRYYFNPEAPFRLDVQEFRRCMSLGERLERDGDTSGAVEAYEAAVSQYRGDLLEDDLYAEWCWEEREHLRELCLGMLRKLGAWYLDAGAPDKSIAWYRRALALDPLREQNHQGLMRALLSAGRRDEALRQYHQCRDILHRELSVAPLPETEHLYRLARESAVSA